MLHLREIISCPCSCQHVFDSLAAILCFSSQGCAAERHGRVNSLPEGGETSPATQSNRQSFITGTHSNIFRKQLIIIAAYRDHLLNMTGWNGIPGKIPLPDKRLKNREQIIQRTIGSNPILPNPPFHHPGWVVGKKQILFAPFASHRSETCCGSACRLIMG